MKPLLQPLTPATLNQWSQTHHPLSTHPSASAEAVEREEESSLPVIEPTPLPGRSNQLSFWRVFASTFITIFLAEIGDKTQVSTLLMSAEFHQPWVIFLGSGAALVATTLIGVWLGKWLSCRVSPRTLDIAAGLLLTIISASLIWDVIQMSLEGV